MTLALLITAVTGAWAADGLTAVELNVPDSWQNGSSTITADDLPGFVAVTIDQAKAWAGAPKTGGAILIYGFSGSDLLYVEFQNGVYNNEYNLPIMRSTLCVIKNAGAKIYYTCAPPVLTPGATAGTWTFSMPASDVVLTPQYAPVAKWAVENEKDQLPTPAEGVIAGTDELIVNPGVVAEIEEDVPQGDVRYYVTTDATFTKAKAEAIAETAWGITPTAETLEAGTYYVWYYISGADTPEGETATAQNTFNDSEICETPLKVIVLSNKFDLTLQPAPVKNMTVTVAGTAATPDEKGKVEAVKMDSEVKLKAADGYKFRKVEVKKGGGEPVLLTTITAADNSSFKSGSQTFGDVATVTLTGDYLKNDGSHGGWYCLGSNKTATISVAEANGANITSVKFYTAGGGSAEDKDAPFEVTTTSVTSSNITTYLNGNSIGSYGVSKIEVYGTK